MGFLDLNKKENNTTKNIKYLIVVAHPDDEVLGAGASMWKWAHNGDQVDVCIMCTEANGTPSAPWNPVLS